MSQFFEMLTGSQILFVGGDARQLEVIKKCIELDGSVTLVGFNHLESSFVGAKKADFSTEVFKNADVVVLPIVGTDEEGNVESIFTTENLKLKDEHFANLPKHCTIYTGMARTYLKTMCKKYEIELVQLLDQDEVAIYNSIPTAEGALMMAIQNTDITIHGSKSAVLGFGRTGITMARVLKALGSDVKVAARRPEQMARIYEMGLKPILVNQLKDEVQGLDLIFNTIPHMIITAQVIANMKPQAVIIDLASKPGGTDFRYAEKRGVKALLAPGLPGIVAPKTAGQIIAKTLTRLVAEQSGNQGEL